MRVIPDLPQLPPKPGRSAPEDREAQTVILDELQKILESPFFQRSHRTSQFLRYVVEHKLGGQTEQLKERTIGVNLYRRPPDYATGDDPVVRVQAGEVRRKLDQYYEALRNQQIYPAVRIELPVGSYSPVFRWAAPENRAGAPDAPPIDPASAQKGAAGGVPAFRKAWLLVALCLAVLGGTAWLANLAWHGRSQTAAETSLTRKFWEPVFSTPQPVLICLAKGVTYRPNEKLYDLYTHAHPGSFQTEVERSNEPLPLDARQPITWGDMNLYDDYGIAEGDVSSALRVSEYLGSIGKPLQVRIGSKYSFEDLRHSPAVVIGAFNNKWTMDLTSGLHFVFVEQPGRTLAIREAVSGGREWHGSTSARTGIPVTDYGIVTRLLDSKTGQFTVTAAGLTGSGTEAAGELATRPEYLEEALRTAPANWEKGNVQIVLQTSVMDRVAGPPRVVASFYWANP